jgi:hypothetical protein
LAKPEKIRASGAALVADGVTIRRVQSLSTDTDITRDQVLELANSGIVQFIEQSPVVTVSIDTNEWGSTTNLALLAGRAINDNAVSNWQDTREGIGFNSINLSSSNAFVITEQDMLDNYCTLAVPILEDQSSTTVARTMVIPRASITGYALNYDVGGAATENFTMQATDKMWYLNNWRDVRAFKLTKWHIGSSSDAAKTYLMANRAGVFSATAQSFIHLGTPLGTPRKNFTSFDFDIEPVALVVNDRIYRATSGGNGEPYDFHTARAAVGTHGSQRVIMATHGNLPSGVSTPFAREGDDVWLIYAPPKNQTWAGATHSTDAGFALVSTAGSFGAASKGYVNAFLYNQGGPVGQTDATAVGRALRLQTVAWDISFSIEALDELGNFNSYGVIKQTPVPVNVTVTANDSDLEIWARAQGKNLLTAKELYLQLFNARNYVRMDVYREKTKDTKLRTITSTGMSVIGESHNVAVGGIAAQEITFTCDNFVAIGTGAEG